VVAGGVRHDVGLSEDQDLAVIDKRVRPVANETIARRDRRYLLGSLERPNAPRAIIAERARARAAERRRQKTETFGRGLGTDTAD
jgi:hypothetical protein